MRVKGQRGWLQLAPASGREVGLLTSSLETLCFSSDTECEKAAKYVKASQCSFLVSPFSPFFSTCVYLSLSSGKNDSTAK